MPSRWFASAVFARQLSAASMALERQRRVRRAAADQVGRYHMGQLDVLLERRRSRDGRRSTEPGARYRLDGADLQRTAELRLWPGEGRSEERRVGKECRSR